MVASCAHHHLQIFGQRAHLPDSLFGGHRALCQRILHAMTYVIVNEFALGVGYGGFDGMKLLRNLQTITSALDHGNQRTQMAFRPFQALRN